MFFYSGIRVSKSREAAARAPSLSHFPRKVRDARPSADFPESPMDLDLFLPLAKVDVDQRTVQGVATAERPDRAGEICDYASTKPYFEAWSAEAEAASGGKSLGAVRAMHGRVAAGKLTDISFDDEGKRILVAAKIVDDDEWQKVMEGVYTHRGARSKSDRDLRRPRWIHDPGARDLRRRDGRSHRRPDDPSARALCSRQFRIQIVLGIRTARSDGHRDDHGFQSRFGELSRPDSEH